MSNFIVSARKYRPTIFDEVVGQEHVTETLKNSIKGNRMAHAFLFTGPRGVGKTSCARILARTINCEQMTEATEACGTCESCKNFDNQSSFNIIELDAASNNSVENIRSLIDQVRYPPQQGSYKVFIIDEVHMLSLSAFNAFLKTLEEPPNHAIFILATTEKNKILPTILSRCQIFDFKRISSKGMVSQLSKIAEDSNIKYEEQALRVIASKADGAMRDALSIFDRVASLSGEGVDYKLVIEHLNVLDFAYYLEITDHLLQMESAPVLKVLDEIIKRGFDLHEFVLGLSEHFRMLLFCQLPGVSELLELSSEVKAQYEQQSYVARKDFLLNAMNLSNECELSYRNSQAKRLHVELMLMKIAHSAYLVTTTTSELVKKKSLNPQLN